MDTRTASPEASLVMSVFERLPVGVLVVDSELHIVGYNKTWTDYIEKFAASPATWLEAGRRLDEGGPTLSGICQRVIDGLDEVCAEGIELITKTGPTYWDVTCRPLGQRGSEDFRVLLTAVDATERVEARGLAREREAQFRRIFETTPDAIIIAEPVSGQIIDANDAACVMHGYTRDEFIGMDSRQLLHPDSYALIETYFGTVLGGGVFRTRGLNVRKDGSTFDVDVSGSAIEQDGVMHIVAIVRDITDEVRAEKALRDTHQRLEMSAADRTQELAMLVDVSRELGSTRDAETLMRRVIERAGALLGYSAGVVLLKEDDRRLRAACVAGADLPINVGDTWPMSALPRCAAVVRKREPAIIGDLSVLGDVAGGAPRIFESAAGGQSWMGIPLLAHERVVGVMAFLHSDRNAFDDEDAALMLALGNQLAAAIENARLFAEADARTREMATLVEVSRDLTSTLEPREILSRTLDRLRDVLGCSGSSLLLMGETEVTILAARGLAIDQLPTAGLEPSDLRFSAETLRPISDAMQRDGAVIIDDVYGEGELAAAFRNASGAYLKTVLSPIRAWMCVPLLRNEQLIGVLAASSLEPAFFQSDHARLATGFAGQVAVALETARLFEEAERRAHDMESLSRVASVLQLDEPVHRVLDRLASRIREATGAVATVVTVVDNVGVIVNAGSAGHPDGFVDSLGDAARAGARSPSAEAARNRRPVIWPKAKQEMLKNRLYAPAHKLISAAEWEGIVIMPMIYRGQSLGTVNAYFAPGAFPDEEELSLLTGLADQAAIAMENIRLFEATERRLRGAQALARVASSLTFDQSLDQTMATLAEAVVGGSRAVASLLLLADDNDEVHVAGVCGLPEGYGEAVIQLFNSGALPPEPMMALDKQEPQILRNARAATLADPSQAPMHKFMLEAEWDTCVIFPVSFHGRAIGTLNAYYTISTMQDEAERAFLATMADQAALALENARLFAETQQHIREMDALYDADAQLHQSLLLDEVLQALVDVVVDALHADKSLVIAYDQAGGPWRVRAQRGYSDDLIAVADGVLAGLEGKSASQNQTRIVEDAEADHRTLHALTGPAGIKAYIDVPIMVGNETFGVFSVNFTSARKFSQEDIRLYTALAQRAALAIENARLFARAQDAASLEERQRLARELHDSVSQALYGIALGARTARTLLDRDATKAREPLDYVLQLAEAGLAELRALIFELRPESLEQEGLIAAFSKQTAALTARHGIEVVTEFGDEPDLPLHVKEGIYRIAQEAMHNTVKHAHAHRVDLRMAAGSAGGLILEVQDDGDGFDADGEFPGHLGLTSMGERARAVGGELSIESVRGKGTTVRLELPGLAVAGASAGRA
jgi:PAS domain S-box-containing protein